jgi:hypothetical protein
MPGNATLGDNLIDDWVADVDELRGDLNADFGTRPFQVFTVLRSWTGLIEGEGDYADVVTEITPAPLVQFCNGYHWVMTPLGTHEDGEFRLVEVSLSYTFDELSPTGLRENQQFFLVLHEAHGQGSPDRYVRNAKPPFEDREKTIGWIMTVMDMNIPNAQQPVLPE